MNHEMMIVLIWLATAISLLVLIQVTVLGALFLMLRAVRSKGKQIERDLRANGVNLYDVAGKFYRMLGSLETAARKAAEIVQSLKQALADRVIRLRTIAAAIQAALGSLGRGHQDRPRAHN